MDVKHRNICTMRMARAGLLQQRLTRVGVVYVEYGINGEGGASLTQGLRLRLLGLWLLEGN
jgi:hypothetical protein